MGENSKKTRRKPATTPEENENECISLAYDLVKKRLRNGTATSQETTHFLKAGSRKYQLEIEELKRKNDLLVAKVESLESQKRVEDLYANALAAMKTYSGRENEDEYEY